jgi:hypothetical protein
MTVLSWAWFKPTQAHDEAGARWFRCDLVTDTTPLRPLPVHADGLLSSGRVGDRWALCSRGHPGRGGNNVSCAQPHRYRLAGILRFASHRGADYPGIKAIKRRGSDRCSDTIVDLGSYGPTISYVGRTRPGPAGGGAVAADGRVPT